jgi:hypothetical protein
MDDVPAAIRSHCLGEWWNTAFRPDDRTAIVAARPWLQKSHRGVHVADLCAYVLVELRYDYTWRRVRPLVDKLLELAPTRRALADRDRAYAQVLEAAWRRRDNDSETLTYVATAKEKRSELARRLKTAPAASGVSATLPNRIYDADRIWGAICEDLGADYLLETANGLEFWLTPLREGLVKRAFISPLAEKGNALHIRIETDDAGFERMRARLEHVLSEVPVRPKVTFARRPSGITYFDLLTPLDLLLGTGTDASEKEERLYQQVVPVFRLLYIDFEPIDQAAGEE